MADDEGGEKTEKPTGKRLSQSRSQGMIARSQDLTQLLSIITSVLVLERMSPLLWEKLQTVFRWGFTSPLGTSQWNANELRWSFLNLVVYLLPDVFILVGIVAFVGAMVTLLQTNFNWSSKLMKPNFAMLNPLAGLKRIFSIGNAFGVLKSIAKLAIIGPIAYSGLMGIFPEFFSLMGLPFQQLLPYTASAAGKIFWDIAEFLLALSILDYAYQKYSVSKKLKMSKHDVQDEAKAMEGDEKVKMKIRQKALQRARQRMLQAVKKADVVVTNPTHYAVALSYTNSSGAAPVVVAKGADFLAARIREIAKENQVPIVERKLLARTLYANVEVGHEIPYELYSAVAEVLAYIFRIKGKNPVKKKRAEIQQARM